MKTALGNQDVEKATNQFISVSQERYQNIFSSLLNQLPDIATNMNSIEIIYLEEGIAQYRIKRIEAEGEITYYIYFVLDENGIWGIKQF